MEVLAPWEETQDVVQVEQAPSQTQKSSFCQQNSAEDVRSNGQWVVERCAGGAYDHEYQNEDNVMWLLILSLLIDR